MNRLKYLWLSLKLYYYSILDYFDEEALSRLPTQVIERKHQNAKLIRGVRKLVARLRNMTPEARLAEENLLSKEPYRKTKQEIREEIRVRHKIIKAPPIKTEDDLVNLVVKKAPMYALQQEARDLRKALTAVLKQASADPTDPSHTDEARRIKAELNALRVDIERMKNE